MFPRALDGAENLPPGSITFELSVGKEAVLDEASGVALSDTPIDKTEKKLVEL
jgi:hypothetical protein